MITIVFILAAFNIVLGFAVAACAEPAAAHLLGWLTPHSGLAPAMGPPLPRDVQSAAATPGQLAAPLPPDKLPPFDPRSLPREWRRLLDENHIKPASTLESLLWMLRLELAILRSQLVHLETDLKDVDPHAAATESPNPLSLALGRWQSIQHAWCLQMDEFAQVMTNLKGQSSDADIESGLQDLLLDQQFDAHQTATSLQLMSDAVGKEAHTTGAANSGTLRRQLSEQIDILHVLRDCIDELLATFLRACGRLDDVDERQQIEGATEIYNRIGFEVIFQRWRDAHPHGEQPVCCLLVDIDRFAQKNERFGNEIGDIIIAAFGGLLKSFIRNERGFDRVARFNGHSYVLFLGHTASENGTAVAERTRQCIEATSFRVAGDSFDVTTSLGLVGYDPQVDPRVFYQSLQEAVASAKNAGRNRTCMLRDGRLEIAATSSIQVKGRVIEIVVP